MSFGTLSGSPWPKGSKGPNTFKGAALRAAPLLQRLFLMRFGFAVWQKPQRFLPT